MRSQEQYEKDCEWGSWECPVCHVMHSDPEFIYATTCDNGHSVLLGTVLKGSRDASLYDETKDS